MSPSRSTQDQRPPLTTAGLVRLAVISLIVLCILGSFAFAAGRHLIGPTDTITVRERTPTDLRRPSQQQPQPRQGVDPMTRSDLRRSLHERETHVA
jgi:hypothetical protein